MLFCSAEKCELCSLTEGTADCLRKQAERCVVISSTVSRRGTRDALIALSLELMDEASAVAKKHQILFW